MGRSYTPKYRAEALLTTGVVWQLSHDGRATPERAEQERQALNRSLQPGGCNWHLSKDCDIMPHVKEYRIIHNDGSGRIAACAVMPMFEVV